MTRREAIRGAALLPLLRWPETGELASAGVYDWAAHDRAVRCRFWWVDWFVKPLQERTQCFSDADLDRMQRMMSQWELARMRNSGLFPSLNAVSLSSDVPSG